jgi:hypothetical protein
VINPVDFVFEYIAQKETIATLTQERDAARAERDALLLRLTVAEENYRFHFDMTQANAAWQKAQAQHGR